jgi:hypothetical protein
MPNFLHLDGTDWLLPDTVDVEQLRANIQRAMRQGEEILTQVNKNGNAVALHINGARVATFAIFEGDAFPRATYEPPTGRAAIRQGRAGGIS